MPPKTSMKKTVKKKALVQSKKKVVQSKKLPLKGIMKSSLKTAARLKGPAAKKAAVKPDSKSRAKVEEKAAMPASPARAPIEPKLKFDAAKVAKEVLRLSETHQHEAILRVLGDDIGPNTGAVAARKAFLRISMLIHPDKLPGLPEATRAFQALVAAFDITQMKGVPLAASKVNNATLSRSNDGCFKHEILCPRCEGPWGKKVEGNPDYYYNFMMEGLKSFTCSTCLLKFGCLTAIHICPFCKGTFDYYPDQYHQKITCGNPCCDRRFGFVLFHASERALVQARELIRRDFEAESRLRQQREDRQKRLARRLGNFNRAEHEEKCFAYGFRDTCPRCGLDLSAQCGDDQAQLRHLRNCNDSNAHRAHQWREERNAAAKATAEKKATAQHNAAAKAIFTFSGGGSSQLWMLTAPQLKKLCSKENLDNDGSRNDLIERLAEKYTKGGQAPAIADMPKNLHSMSSADLAAVCAAHGIKGASSRADRLDALEELATGVPNLNDAPKALEGRAKALAITDKKYLLKQGKRVVSSKDSVPKAKAGLTPPRKRCRVLDD